MFCKIINWFLDWPSRFDRWKSVWKNHHRFYVIFWTNKDCVGSRHKTYTMTYDDACSLADTFGGEVIYDGDGTVVFSSQGMKE